MSDTIVPDADAWNADFDARARELVRAQHGEPHFQPNEMQHAVGRLLAQRKRVIAIAPTGSGKTLAAALPFAANLLSPAQMVFMTPMRTLTSAQADTLTKSFDEKAVARYLDLRESAWSVQQQTGTAPDDPDFEATATVATFDQALSSALRISYSASQRRRTVNAGAVLGSYLVADELHLFPRGEALTTLLFLLKHRPPDLPFLLITATLTPTTAQTLTQLLDATLYDTPLSAHDLAALGLTTRRRHVRWQAEPLTAEQIVRAHECNPERRILVVVNTVRRAIELGKALDAALGRERLRVLHARFYQEDRGRHEAAVKAAFNRERAGAVQVAVATQVVEVGLDISADLIFTELAPASALVQRWGRSARWGGEAEIIVAPPSADPDARVYPYVGKDDVEVVAKTRAWLEANAAGADGIVMDTPQEQDALISAHREADEKWADQLAGALTARAQPVGDAVAEGRYDLAGSLIRHVNSRTVLIWGEPDKQLTEPYGMEGFSLSPGALMPLLPDAEKANATEADLADDEDDIISLGLPDDASWRLKYPIWTEDAEGTEARANTVSRWETITKRVEIQRQPVLAIHPEIVSYDPFFGLSLESGDQPVPVAFWARWSKRRRPSWVGGSYTRETYEQHIGRMLKLYADYPVLGPRLRRIAPMVEAWLGWPAGTMDRLTRAAIVAHDAGKLSAAWQKHIADFQRAVGKQPIPWLVHSDSKDGKHVPWRPPHHALSGAVHSMQVGAALDAEVTAAALPQFAGALPSNVLFTAIATHHTPTLQNYFLTGKEQLESRGVAELNRLLALHLLPPQAAQTSEDNLEGAGVQQADVDSDMGMGEDFALALVIRMLRLADGWSQEPGRLEVVEATSEWSELSQTASDSSEGGHK